MKSILEANILLAKVCLQNKRLEAALDEALGLLASCGDDSWGENHANRIRKDYGLETRPLTPATPSW